MFISNNRTSLLKGKFVKTSKSLKNYETDCTIYINIKVFNRVDRKQLNILKTFLEYLDFILLLYLAAKDDSALEVS